jgi:hypothetical protein
MPDASPRTLQMLIHNVICESSGIVPSFFVVHSAVDWGSSGDTEMGMRESLAIPAVCIDLRATCEDPCESGS